MSYRIARSRLWQMLTLAGNRWRRPARVASRRIGLFSLFVFLSMGIQVPGSRGLGPSTALGEPIPIADIQHEGEVDFAKEILPILRKKCLACHNATDAEGELVLESPQTILQGGSEGPVIAAGKPMESRLLKLASFQDDPAMPPEDNDVGAAPLTPEELGLIKQWIQQGAKGEIVAGSRSIQWHPIPSRMTPIYAVGLSPDGAYVAAGRANDIILYRTADQQSLGRLSDPALKGVVPGDEPPPAHLDLVQSLSFGPRGQLLASGGYRTVKIWRPAPRLTATWQLGEGSASAASLQPLGPGATVASAEAYS